jgi:hypothetical protein
VFICGAGSQLSWLYAWASFLIFSFFQCLYPLPETLGTFSLAVFLTLYSRGRGWRVIYVVAVHLTALSFISLWVIKVFYYPGEPLWNQNWLADFMGRPREQAEWLLLIFVLGYTMGFWVAGNWFARHEKSYTSACSRFDRGIVAFFGLFLIKLVLQTQMGIQFQDSIPILMVFPFFIFSLTEIGLVCGRHDNQSADYLSGYYAVGVLVSFTVGALITGIAIFLFFLPHLKTASGIGYDVIRGAAKPLAPLLIALIRFLLNNTKDSSKIPGVSSSSGVSGTGEFGIWTEVLMWVGGIMVLAIGIAVVGLILWYTIRWLFQKRVGGEMSGHQWNLLSWWQRLKTIFYTCCEWILRTVAKQSALEFYAALRRWGRYSGLPPEANETPLEYGRRLSRRFPRVKTEILLIIEMLHREVYGESRLQPRQIQTIRMSWKKLQSPLRWPFRIKSLMRPTVR